LEDNGIAFAESGVYFQIAENAEFRHFRVNSRVGLVPQSGTRLGRTPECADIRRISSTEEIMLQHTPTAPNFRLQFGNGS